MFLEPVPWDGAVKTRERCDPRASCNACVLVFWFPPPLGKHRSLIRARLSWSRSGGERMEGNDFAEQSYRAEDWMPGIAVSGERGAVRGVRGAASGSKPRQDGP